MTQSVTDRNVDKQKTHMDVDREKEKYMYRKKKTTKMGRQEEK